MTDERAVSHWKIVLGLLRSGPKTTSEFISSQFGLAADYRGAISTLRKKGFIVTARRLRKSNYEYKLQFEPLKTGKERIACQ